MTEPAPKPPVSDARKWGVPFAVVGAITLAIIIVFNLVPKRAPEPAPPAARSTFDLRGTLVLTDSGLLRLPSNSCAGQRGYDDIGPNAQVTVSADGKVVAVGFLGVGVFQGSVQCVFPVFVDGVPLGHDFYSVEVGHRGKLNYPASTLQSEPIRITLG